jgi:co-chaperonin GroES (HSP10)
MYAAAHASQLRMRGDRILLRPMKWEPSKIIEVVRQGRALRGEVVAIGPGIYPVSKRVTQADGRKRVEYSKHFRPTEVKVGDVVELGGLNIFDGKGYQFTEVLVGSETMIVCTERDVAGVVDG